MNTIRYAAVSIALSWLCGSPLSTANENATDELWNHLRSADQLVDVRDASVKFADAAETRTLRFQVTQAPTLQKTAWVAVPAPAAGWQLGQTKSVCVTAKNTGQSKTSVTLWVVGTSGWSAVGDAAELAAGQSQTLCCDLRDSFKDGTPRIDPNQIRQIRFMVQNVNTTSLEFRKLITQGSADAFKPSAGRLSVPKLTNGNPAPGRRVRYPLAGAESDDLYCVVYLPTDWTPGASFPVIAEFPGNFYCHAGRCWSPGRPEQCVIGYGATKGQGAIWISLPFVDRETNSVAESGFGSDAGDDTVDYANRALDEICSRWGGDPDNVVLSGFSRGAIACGYIGLRNKTMAQRWKGFITCQHYDGSNWRQSNLPDAVVRAPRFAGQAIFQLDNSQAKYQAVVDATDPAVVWTWAQSGLGDHDTAMFLDDRPCMKQLRKWFDDLVGS
ncbi:hypothetical protein [Planctomycetes bacterium K23_9]|uniref:Uncharacterized protein n=1 Tax=Stieleria marina TaxID=1930275 RepID=A0A517NW98_9BACT|nr:hypothetical protein K239x_33970 [Planctomycetes bacterium K23_9]